VAAAPVAPAAVVRGDEFRSVLGIALSSSTRLAVVALAAGLALVGAPGGAAAQTAPSAQTAASAQTTESVQPAQPAQPAPAALSAATQNALVQSALRQAALRQVSQAAPARLGRGAAAVTSQPPAPPAPAPTPEAAARSRQGATAAAAARAAQTPATAPAQGFAATPPSSTAPPVPTAGMADTMVARLAPTMDLRVGEQGKGLRLSGTVGVVVMMGLLTLLPTLVLMMTGFTRILVVLHFLKQALGTQNAPPNHLVGALAILLTGFVMAPTIGEVNRVALQPWLDGRIEQVEMMQRGSAPLREFMLRQTRERDLQTFVEMSRMEQAPRTPDDVPLVVVMSAFVTSELRTAFQLGFALFLPFIVIDVVVSAVLMSMGMMMLPPAMIALPFKLLLFVLVDGWTLVIQSLVQSFR
jgi:flagellar biosynthetic protein FliP